MCLLQANVAKLETTFSVSGDKLELKIFGFSEKLPVLASKILKFMTTFTPAADRFEVKLKKHLFHNILMTGQVILLNETRIILFGWWIFGISLNLLFPSSLSMCINYYSIAMIDI
jgi:hypothetical protein